MLITLVLFRLDFIDRPDFWLCFLSHTLLLGTLTDNRFAISRPNYAVDGKVAKMLAHNISVPDSQMGSLTRAAHPKY